MSGRAQNLQNPKFATWRYDSTVGAAALGILIVRNVCPTRELNCKPLSVDVLPREVVERWCYMLWNLRLAVVSPVSRHGSTSDIAPYGLLDMNRLHSAWNQSILDCFAERHPALLALVHFISVLEMDHKAREGAGWR